LVGSQVWQKLRVLQIWGGRFDDKGAKALAKCKALKNLTFLDLSFNWLTATGIAALRKTGVNLVAEHQLTSSTDTDIDWADDVDDEFEDDDFYNDFEDEFGDDDSEWE
jgi:lambda repressor-like predicted transcriptional regulator